jgi:class 3 adenylate cyclase
VNLAARLEPLCGAMEILISQSTYDRIQTEFRISDYGEFDIRGFGKQTIYRLDGDFVTANDTFPF